MKLTIRKWTSLAIIFALLTAMLPVFSVQAASGPISISNLFTPTDVQLAANNFDSQIPRYTTSNIDVVVTVPGENIDRISEMYYDVVNETMNVTDEYKLNKPQKTGTYEVTFHNVALKEGRNKIVVKLGETSTISSQPGYVYYTAVSNITDLNLDGAPFADNQIMPTTAKTSFIINGTAPNATSVSAIINSGTTPSNAQVNNGKFFFVAEDATLPPAQQQSSFKLNPGDNTIDITATNSGNSYRASRHLIYDNGNPFPFQVTVTENGGTAATPASKVLYKDNNYTPADASSAGSVKISGKLKVNVMPASSPSVTAYVYGELRVRGNLEDTIDFSTLNKDNTLSKPGVYDVYDYSKIVTLTNDRGQNIEFSFVDRQNNARVVKQVIPFNYVRPDASYVQNVNQANGGILSESARNEITETPLKLDVQTKNSSGINVYLGEGSTTPVAQYLPGPPEVTNGVTKDTSTAGLFHVDLGSIPDGVTKLTVVPLDPNAANAEDSSGQKVYDLNITSVPYVIVNSLSSGMVVKNKADISCTSTNGTSGNITGPCISGRIVNLPASEYQNVVFTINGVEPKDSSSNRLFNPSISADGTFKFALPYPAYDLVEGLNTIKFQLNRNGSVITEKSLQVFLFSTGNPEFVSISPQAQEGVNKFIAGPNNGSYSTTEPYVKFIGLFNGDTTGLSITVRKKDSDGKPVITYDKMPTFTSIPLATRTNGTIQSTDVRYIDPATNMPIPLEFIKGIPAAGSLTTPGTFETEFIKLMPTGDTIITFEATNANGATTVQSITITRQPVAYKVRTPILAKNEKNEDQANINSNFVNMVIEAEGADSILFGKDAAAKDSSNGTDVFTYEVRDLKPGKNTVKFVVVRGTSKTTGTVIVNNADTPLEGAQYRTMLASKMNVFNGNIELSFPKGTQLMRNKPGSLNQNLSTTRQIMFGIADSVDGRVDKFKHPTAADVTASNIQYLTAAPDTGKLLLTESTGRFRPASSLYWIDAGTIKDKLNTQTDEDYQKDAITGSGRDPYEGDEFYNRNINDQVVPTQRGTLKLKFDPNIRADAWKYVTVQHLDKFEDYTGTMGYRWKNLGGIVDNKNNTIEVPFENFGYYRVMYMYKSFDDVTSHPWARNELDTLYAKGIMLNKDSSSFSPYDSISRGEFATMLVKIFDVPLNFDGQGSFADVFKNDPSSNGLYEYKYIETAARAGIVRGTALNAFAPGDGITRQDAAVMIARAAEYKISDDIKKSMASLQKTFTDAGSIDAYAAPSVDAISKAKLIEGKLNGDGKTVSFDPLASFTRAEAAAIAMRVLKSQGKTPKN